METHGVMVTHRFLVPIFGVRVPVGLQNTLIISYLKVKGTKIETK